MKHALGLATHCGRNFKLFYVFFEGSGRKAEAHKNEIRVFKKLLRSEIGFEEFSYQELINQLKSVLEIPAIYIVYLQQRYRQGTTEQITKVDRNVWLNSTVMC